MVSSVTDKDGQSILAACPFYKENPLCVNSCALFMPYINDKTGVTDYSCGQCGLGNGLTQFMVALSAEEEATFRKKRGYE